MALPKNPDETFALENFELVVKDLGFDSGTLMRFLRARNLDLSKAEQMIRAFANWRDDNAYEKAIVARGWKPPTEFLLKFEVFRTGFDPQGRPVFYLKFDNWLPCRALFEEFKPFEFLVFAYRSMCILYESILESSNQQIIAIVDNEGIGFTKIFHEVQYWTSVQTLIDVWMIYEANFPETLYKGFFINTARAVVWGFNLVKPFMSKDTIAKIQIYGSDQNKWKDALEEELSPDLIPHCCGGRAKLTHLYDILYDGAIRKLSHPS